MNSGGGTEPSDLRHRGARCKQREPCLLHRGIQLQVFLGIRSLQLRRACSRRRLPLLGRPQLRLGPLQLGPHLAQRLVMLLRRLLHSVSERQRAALQVCLLASCMHTPAIVSHGCTPLSPAK